MPMDRFNASLEEGEYTRERFCKLVMSMPGEFSRAELYKPSEQKNGNRQKGW
jgi:hypothetical protein